MRGKRFILVALLLCAAALPACRKASSLVADDAKRKAIIEALVSNPPMRQEVIDRLIGPPADRAVVIDRILKDEDAASHLVQKIMVDDRGKALVASRVAADPGAKTFIRMLMLTGVMGESMTQKQASAMGLGEAFAFGNQRRTMADLKRIGNVIDEWAKQKEGRYPVCYDYKEVGSCLAKQLPPDSLQGFRLKDAWGNPYQYHTDREGTGYILVSYSSDGQYDGLGKVGPTDSFDCDIVFSNEGFIQWPGWFRKDDVR
jgi:hypothetical protein